MSSDGGGVRPDSFVATIVTVGHRACYANACIWTCRNSGSWRFNAGRGLPPTMKVTLQARGCPLVMTVFLAPPWSLGQVGAAPFVRKRLSATIMAMLQDLVQA